MIFVTIHTMNDAIKTQNPDVYQLDKLMEETRSLAAKYRAGTGQTLPVTHDLACYDAIRLLDLNRPVEVEAGIDAIKTSDSEPELLKYNIKGRVQFSNVRTKQQRIGQLNLDADWNLCLLVIMEDDYFPTLILAASRDSIDEVLKDKPANKRGAMTVAQFRIISELVWEKEASAEAQA